ncbi:MAG: hypothetical protein ISS45_03180 [Candidatus Omnitrophica bacterium]|nr:hypothetical protein [Candidatus Omnitrophota bacterium]
MPTIYDLNKIKFATDEATFKRAVGLYEGDKMTETECFFFGRNIKAARSYK